MKSSICLDSCQEVVYYSKTYFVLLMTKIKHDRAASTCRTPALVLSLSLLTSVVFWLSLPVTWLA